MKQFDPDLVDRLITHSEDLGIQIHLDTKLESIEKTKSGFEVHASRNGENLHWPCDALINGAGRVPDLEELNLDEGNIEYEKKGIRVNEFMQSVSNPRVYAAGDAAATSGLPLTPVASMESYAVAANLLKGNHRKPDYSVMPSVLFTHPKLAIVGLTEKDARDKGFKVSTSLTDTSGWYAYRRTNENHAMVKTVTDEETGNLLGVHVLGGNADELINHFTTIIRLKLPSSELKKTIFAYPTSASDLAYLI